MDTVKDLAQILYYLTLSVAGPLALIEYFKAKKRDRLANEYKIYDELNNRFFEYQKIALEYYDLDILDVPNDDPSLSFDKKRKQEMVAYSILFSLFERAYLMFIHQEEQFQLRQWSGWKHFLNDFICRESVRTAWGLSKGTYDTGFQQFMDEKIAEIQSRPESTIGYEAGASNLPRTGSNGRVVTCLARRTNRHRHRRKDYWSWTHPNERLLNESRSPPSHSRRSERATLRTR